MVKEVKIAKVYTGLYDEFARIAHLRLLNKLDKKYKPITVQKKMLRHPSWKQIKKDLEVAEFLEDRK